MIDCKLSDGKIRQLRHVSVSVIAVNEKAEVLLIKKKKSDGIEVQYEIPGGFLNPDEDTALAALRGLERTGFFGKTLLLFQVNDNPNKSKNIEQNVDFVYVIQVTGGQAAKHNDFESVMWCAFDKLPPENDFLSDHRKTIELYFQYQYNPFTLPILGRTTRAYD